MLRNCVYPWKMAMDRWLSLTVTGDYKRLWRARWSSRKSTDLDRPLRPNRRYLKGWE